MPTAARPSRVRHLVAVGTAALLALSATVVGAPAGADRAAPERHHGTGDGSQPLPGYTVSNPPLAPLTVGGRPTRVLQGVRDHAAYDIEIPPRWNGQLVMWAHGYRGTGTVLTVDPPGFGLRRRLAEQGYAWAASSYARNGYDVRTGVTTTRSLAEYAARVLPRRPRRTYVAGVSMGGHVIGRSLEEYPHLYDGALPMCGVLGDHELFDYFLGYNLVAQDLADVDAYPVPADYQGHGGAGDQVRAGHRRPGRSPGRQPARRPAARRHHAASPVARARAPTSPTPSGRTSCSPWPRPTTGVASPSTPVASPRTVTSPTRPPARSTSTLTVERVAPADRRTRTSRRLTQIPRIEGRPRVPTLTLHGLGDLFVPFSMEQIYAREVSDRRRSRLLVQRAVRAAGHCEFTPTEVGRAWDDLTDWVESLDRKHRGRVDRPAGDDVLTRSVVADPTYGCAFTDPAAYDSPELYATRGLYPRCPAP